MAENPKETRSNQLIIEIDAAETELKSFVESIARSKSLPQGPTVFFVNLKTLEGQTACIELSIQGWRIISQQFDCTNEERGTLPDRHFETMEQLLNVVSAKYRERFAHSLNEALTNLQNSRNNS